MITLKKSITSLMFFVFTSMQIWSIENREYNILDFGASTDTTLVHTKAINKAIEACYKNGGGKVVIPSGKFRSGTIILKSNVELFLENGAHLIASDNNDDFRIMPQANYRSLKDAGGWVALIFAEEAENIAITGYGKIDGRGKKRKGVIKGFGGDLDGRPRNILFISCKKVNISGVSMYNSAMWNQHYLNCEDVRVDNIYVFNHANGNNDGIDIDGCRRFTLTNSTIDSDDDGIVLKSTGIAPCEDIVISNCIVSSYANGIKCGTESTGGYKNILISNCIIRPSQNKGDRIIKSTPSGITGISLEVVDGGVMDGVNISNILIEGTECPLYIRLANRGRKHLSDAPTPPIGKMKNISISDVLAYNTGNFCSSITGIPQAKIENVYLSNIRFINRGGLLKGNFRQLETDNKTRHDMSKDLQLDKYLESFQQVEEDERGYPQPTVWANLPSYGLFIRNVEKIEVNNASFSSQAEEPRTPIIAVNVNSLKISQMTSSKSSNPNVIIHKVDQLDVDEGLKVNEVK